MGGAASIASHRLQKLQSDQRRLREAQPKKPYSRFADFPSFDSHEYEKQAEPDMHYRQDVKRFHEEQGVLNELAQGEVEHILPKNGIMEVYAEASLQHRRPPLQHSKFRVPFENLTALYCELHGKVYVPKVEADIMTWNPLHWQEEEAADDKENGKGNEEFARDLARFTRADVQQFMKILNISLLDAVELDKKLCEKQVRKGRKIQKDHAKRAELTLLKRILANAGDDNRLKLARRIFRSNLPQEQKVDRLNAALKDEKQKAVRRAQQQEADSAKPELARPRGATSIRPSLASQQAVSRRLASAGAIVNSPAPGPTAFPLTAQRNARERQLQQQVEVSERPQSAGSVSAAASTSKSSPSKGSPGKAHSASRPKSAGSVSRSASPASTGRGLSKASSMASIADQNTRKGFSKEDSINFLAISRRIAAEDW